ncbi:hypothetical protein BC835DRAFT_1309495 [Cytidiella melzeri]|nr:hypothetical protein BC835DRAFT_1309495 [Cytidiella melzeri]
MSTDMELWVLAPYTSHELSSVKDVAEAIRRNYTDLDPVECRLYKVGEAQRTPQCPGISLVSPDTLHKRARRANYDNMFTRLQPYETVGKHFREFASQTLQVNVFVIPAHIKERGQMHQLCDKFWGEPLSEFITVVNVPRDGERPDVSAPETVLFIEHELHGNRGMIIRDTYLRALGHILAKCWRNDKNNELSLGAGPTLNNPFEDEEIVPKAPLTTVVSSVSVSGHPGIGKTLWLYFVLMLRLAAKLPTIFQPYSGEYHYFHRGGFDELKDNELLDVVPRTEKCTWWLIDSTQNNFVPSVHVLNSGRFILHTASPRRDRFTWMNKVLSPFMYYMEPWSAAELICAQIARERPLPESTIMRYAELYGHDVRKISGLSISDSGWEEKDWLGQAALGGMNLEGFVYAVRHLGWFIEDNGYEEILTVVPDDNDPFKNPCLTFATHRLFRDVYDSIIAGDTDKSNRLYAAMSTVPFTKPIAGLVYERRAREFLQGSDEWTLYPMVSVSKITKLHISRDESRGLGGILVRRGLQQRPLYSKREVTHAEPSCYYVPGGSNKASFDAFFYERDVEFAGKNTNPSRFTVFQMTLVDEHDVEPHGLQWLKQIDARACIRYVVVTPSTTKLSLEVGLEHGDLVQEWYQLFYDIGRV